MAFGRNVSQTRAWTTRPPTQAVDGHEEQSDWENCSYTGDGKNPWLRLDIAKNALIWYIRILPTKSGKR